MRMMVRVLLANRLQMLILVGPRVLHALQRRFLAGASSGEHPRRQLSGVADRSPRVHASSIGRRPDPATAGLLSLNHQLG